MDFGKINVTMTTDEAVMVKNLLKRDEPRAVIKKDGKFDSGVTFTYFKCPVCDGVLSDDAVFCSRCGQRVDTTVYEF